MSRQRLKNGASELQAINRRRDIHRKTIPALAQAGPVSVWMVLFVTIPMLYIIYVSFMSRGVFGDVVYEFSLESYQTLLDSTYFKVIVKSLQVALFTTVACLLLGYPINDMTYIKPIYHVIQDIGAYGPKYYTRNLSDEITPDYPATYHWHGVNDTLLKELVYWRQGPQLEAALQANHVKHVYRVFNNAPHVCGIGTGTDAENWLVEATAFWEEQCA